MSNCSIAFTPCSIIYHHCLSFIITSPTTLILYAVIFCRLDVPSLKLTFSHLKMDGWNTFSFPFGAKGLFSGAKMLVSGDKQWWLISFIATEVEVHEHLCLCGRGSKMVPWPRCCRNSWVYARLGYGERTSWKKQTSGMHTWKKQTYAPCMEYLW